MNPLKYNPLKSSFSSEHIHESEVKSFVNEWLRNVNEENLSAIVNMYSRNAILLPTLSSEICVGREEIQRYFVQFLGKEELQGRFTNSTFKFSMTHFSLGKILVTETLDRKTVVK